MEPLALDIPSTELGNKPTCPEIGRKEQVDEGPAIMPNNLYPRLLTMITAAEGVIGEYPSFIYSVSNILYRTTTEIEPFIPLDPKGVIQTNKNLKTTIELAAIAGYLKSHPEPKPEEVIAKLKKVGQWISDTILPKHCLECCNNGLPASIEIITNQHDVPWELAWINDDFLAGKIVHARIPYVAKSRSQSSIYGSPPRMVIVVGKTDGLFSAAEEVKELTRIYKEAFGVEPHVFDGETATVDLLRSLMLGAIFEDPCDVIHFIGHGNSSGAHVYLEFLGSPFLTDDVPSYIAGNPLLFWNSCFGASSPPPSCGYQARIIDAFGSRLLANGAGHFIGPLFPIVDSTAKNFSVSFYQKLFSGTPVGRAFFEAKGAHRALNPVVNAYALYGSANSRIVGNAS